MVDLPTIQQLVERSGQKIAAIEREAGIGKDTLRNLLRGHSNDTGAESAYHLAKFFGVRMEDLLGLPVLGKSHFAEQLPIRYETGAGLWAPVTQYETSYPEMVETTPIKGIPVSDQWLEKIIGDSVDRIIPKGALVHVVSAAVRSYSHGDIVIIEQVRDGGHLVMRTAKQVAFTSAGVEFWPRSYNDRWDGPITLNHDATDERASISVAGIVKRAIIEL